MTQETADRIFELMRDIRLWDAEHDALDHRAVARQIAAEIDTLAAKVKECDDNTDFVEGLREAERAALADTRQSLAVATVKIDALTRERDEARATIAANNKLLHDAGADFDRMMRERDEARAEADRLRPAAEAWEAYDDYMTCPETEEAAKFPVWIAAHRAAKGAQAARAAKESQP